MPEDASGAGHAQAPIIVKRVKKADHGHHGGAWKVAYADMVTALMALFIVLWILSQSDEVIQSVAGYFRDPVGFKDGGNATLIDGGGSASQVSVFEDEERERKSEDSEGSEARWRMHAEHIQDSLAGLENIDKYADQIELSLTPEGLRITLVETNEAPLFEIGGTEINPDAEAILGAIADVVRKLHNHITIEGHTDSVRFVRGSGRSNWELSTGRAHTARKVLESAGIDRGRMFEVRGLADRMLYNPLDPEDSRNRRVAITVLSNAALEERLKEVSETILSEDVTEQGVAAPD